MIPNSLQKSYPLCLNETRLHISIEFLVGELLNKLIAQYSRESIPTANHIGMHTVYRTIAGIGRMIDKYHIRTKEAFLVGLSHTGLCQHSFALEGVIAVEQEEKNDGKREAVAVGIGQCACHDLGSHIASLACNAEVSTMEDDIVVVADKDVARLRVNEKVAIV